MNIKNQNFYEKYGPVFECLKESDLRLLLDKTSIIESIINENQKLLNNFKEDIRFVKRNEIST